MVESAFEALLSPSVNLLYSSAPAFLFSFFYGFYFFIELFVLFSIIFLISLISLCVLVVY